MLKVTLAGLTEALHIVVDILLIAAALLWIASSAIGGSSHTVGIKLSRPAILAGDSIDLTCYVDRLEANRSLQMGLASATGFVLAGPSDISLAGSKEPERIFHRHYPSVPCDVTQAYCTTFDAKNRVLDRAVAPVTVGCPSAY